MARPKKNTTQLSIRVPDEWLAEADNVLQSPELFDAFPNLAYGGRVDVFRVAISLGLSEIRKRVRRAEREAIEGAEDMIAAVLERGTEPDRITENGRPLTDEGAARLLARVAKRASKKSQPKAK